MKAVGDIELPGLLLDSANPRLPESLRDRSQEAMLEHLYRSAALQELAESIFSNGYFSSEPVIVSPARPDGKRVVLEGNRRLATSLILSGEARAADIGLGFKVDGEPARKVISTLPAVEVDDEDEFEAYLGFRHISGLRMWGSGEKARYLWAKIKQLPADANAFYKIGRQIGSNARGVRSAYIAYEVLEHGEREGIDPALIEFVRGERFGVWTRLLGTRNVDDYIGLTQGSVSLPDVDAAIANVQPRRLEEVLRDLRPPPGRAEAVIRDSRQVTDYSDVLADKQALEILRSSGNLDLATAIANRPDVDAQIQGIIDRVEVLTSAITDDAPITEESEHLASRLSKISRVLQMTIASYREEQ